MLLQSSICDMQDKKKIEADEPVFGLASVDLVEVEAPTWHIAQHLPAIRWVTPPPLHCICHHCLAPQTWLFAQHLPAIIVTSHPTGSADVGQPQ